MAEPTPLDQLEYDYRLAFSKTFRAQFDLDSEQVKILHSLAVHPNQTTKELLVAYSIEAINVLVEYGLVMELEGRFPVEYGLTLEGEARYRAVCAWQPKSKRGRHV